MGVQLSFQGLALVCLRGARRGSFGQEGNLGVKQLSISDIHLWTPPRTSRGPVKSQAGLATPGQELGGGSGPEVAVQ